MGRLAEADLTANRRLLAAIALAAPMGFIAIEAGWTVTEVGPAAVDHPRRAPHRRRGDADARTDRARSCCLRLLYCFLGVIVVWLLYRQIVRSPPPTEWSRIYTPGGAPVSELDLPDLLAALLVLSLNAYVLFGGADFGGGVWDLLASGPRNEPPARADRACDRPDLGGQPCLADLLPSCSPSPVSHRWLPGWARCCTFRSP